MVGTRRLTQLVRSASKRLELPPTPVAVALSGGADSAALGFLLLEAGIPTRAIHVDHGLPASPRLRSAAADIARRLDLDLRVLRVELGSASSPEGRARRARYRALVADLSQGEWLATGHTMDDQAETVLWAMLRGSGARGLAAMAPRRRPIARPMLDVTRAETREMATLAGLPFVDDPMNLDVSLTRNSIRHQLMPWLESRYNPKLRSALHRVAQALATDNEFMEGATDQFPLEASEQTVRIPLGVLRTVHRALAIRLVRRASRVIAPPYASGGDELGRILDVIEGRAASTQLEGGLTVRIAGPHLLLERPESVPMPEPVTLDPGAAVWSGFHFGVEAVTGRPRVFPLGHWQAIFDSEARLTVRPAGPDDPFPAPGAGWPVVEVEGRPVWIPGVRRFPVAWYQEGAPGYLSVSVQEEERWT